MKSRFVFENWDKAYNLYKCSDIESRMVASSIVEENPEVTFVIPAYKRADVIQDTIYSIIKQKTSYKFIIMIIDDSGDDESVQNCVVEIIKKNKNIILYKNSSNIGQAANWNRCIELAKTKWMVIIHDDDMICDNYLEKVMPIANKCNCAEVGVFQYKYDLLKHTDKKGEKFNKSQSSAQWILSKIRKGAPFYVYPRDIFQFIVPSPGCWLINREQALKNGGFNPDFGVTLDGVFHFKNIVAGKVVIVPEFLMIRRIEENIFLKKEAQIAVIDMLYHFGRYMMEQNVKYRNIYYNLVLDISTIYLGDGINAKYNGKSDIRALLKTYDVNKVLLFLPPKMIYFMNCLLLTKLVLRKKV